MATELTKKQKKEWAKMLFIKEHCTQGEIAEKIGVSRVTVNKWAKEGKWEELKVGITMTKEEQIKNIYRQIGNINATILSRPEGERFATSSEADAIGKLTAAAKKMESEAGIAETISTGMKFIEWVRKSDLSQAKEVTYLWDAFIKSLL